MDVERGEGVDVEGGEGREGWKRGRGRSNAQSRKHSSPNNLNAVSLLTLHAFGGQAGSGGGIWLGSSES